MIDMFASILQATRFGSQASQKVIVIFSSVLWLQLMGFICNLHEF